MRRRPLVPHRQVFALCGILFAMFALFVCVASRPMFATHLKGVPADIDPSFHPRTTRTLQEEASEPSTGMPPLPILHPTHKTFVNSPYDIAEAMEQLDFMEEQETLRSNRG